MPQPLPTDADRSLTDADAEAIAQRMVDKLIERLTDRDTVEQITGTWGGYVDRALGRGMRRIALYVVIALMAVAAVKLDLMSKLLKP